MQIDEQAVQQVVANVLRRLQAAEVTVSRGAPHDQPRTAHGVFSTVDEAVGFATQAQRELAALSLNQRQARINAMRTTALLHADEWARLARDETGLGRYEHKVIKNQMAASKSPGVEDLKIAAQRGDEGLTLHDFLPLGVICAITPVTNPTSTIINNGLIMIAAGNSVVFCPHPSTARCTRAAMTTLNDAIASAGGPRNCLTMVAEPSIRHATEAMKHRGTNVIVATGGPAVVRAALEQPKRAICAGPGNPPVVVDETADIAAAARHIVAGCGFDNNLPCIGEKTCVVVDSVADELIRELKRNGAHEVCGANARRLSELVMRQHGERHEMNRDLIGQDASVILQALGEHVAGDPPIAFYETDRDDPCVLEEQLMPVLPIVRVRSFDEAEYVARAAEGGRGHTVILHSRNLDRIAQLRAAIACTVFVVNGPSAAGDGVGGEGWLSMTIAGHTGEGFTRPRTFTKQRRLALAGWRL